MTDPFEPLRTCLRLEGLDAAALVPGPSFRRLMGRDFHLMERPLVLVIPAGGPPVAVVPRLERASFDGLGFPGAVFDWTDHAGPAAAFAAAATATGPLGRIGVEGQRMRVFEGMALARAWPGATIVDAHGPLSALRLRKTPDEIARLTQAIRRSEAALEATLPQVRIGQTETEIAGILIRELFAHGAEGLAFDPIVAAGANSAEPHATPRPDYRIGTGDALLFDFGGSVGGMHADITRTVFVAEASERDRALYATVAAAKAAGRATARPGVTAHAVDDAVQTVLEASPFAAAIRHKTGHGLGLDVHEAPHIIRGNATVLEPGMVFTIEPGLYLDGMAGVRIEDDVVVTENGLASLTTFPKDLRLVAGT